MSEQKPALSLNYLLNIDESQDGFKLMTLGKKQLTQWITPLISVGLIIWGFYLGFSGIGRYYVGLGAVFLTLQLTVRYVVLPMIFKRQFVKYQLGRNEQTISLFQHYFEVVSNGRQKTYTYSEVKHFAQGKLTYVIELKTRVVIIVPKRVMTESHQMTVFENTFKK